MEERLQLLAVAERAEAWILQDEHDGDPPQYGLLLGVAALSERETRSAVESLRSAFKEFGRTV
jgi:DNA-binding transcriptional MocR family regulator